MEMSREKIEVLQEFADGYWLTGNYVSEQLGRPDLVLTDEEREIHSHVEILDALLNVSIGKNGVNDLVTQYVFDTRREIKELDLYKSADKKVKALEGVLRNG